MHPGRAARGRVRGAAEAKTTVSAVRGRLGILSRVASGIARAWSSSLTPAANSHQARTCLRQARTDIEDETLSRGQGSTTSGPRPGQTVIHARSSVIRPGQQRLNVGRTPAQDILMAARRA